MSDIATTPPGFALRGADLAESARVFRVVDDLERERRIRRLVTIGGGWIVATLMTGVAVACLGVMWVRPVPQDRHWVAVVNADGTYDPPVVREDLSRSQQAMLFQYTVQQYVREHVVGDYFSGRFDGNGEMLMCLPARLSSTSAQELQQKIQQLASELARLHQSDRKLDTSEREGVTLLLGFRSWEFGAFTALRRK